MKIVLILLLVSFLAISSSRRRHKLAPNENNCPLLLPVQVKSHTIFIDLDNNSDVALKKCILKNSHIEQTVVLLNIYGIREIIPVNVTQRQLGPNDNPNIIIMTKYLSLNIIDAPLFKFFIISHWSLLYLVFTSDTKFKCVNGTMDSSDFILLENIMNKLWHKHKVVHVGVALPFACKQKMVIYNGKRFPANQTLFDRPIKIIDITNSEDLHGAIIESGYRIAEHYPMRGSIFYRYPTSITECQKLQHYYKGYNLNLSIGFCGLDGMVMHDVLSYFKFDLSYPADKNCDNFGYENPGKVSGSLGCIIRKELDISFNARFMTLYSSDKVYYLHHVSTDSLCALVKKSAVIPVWLGVINVYKTHLWLLITTIIVALGVIMWAMAVISETLTGEKSKTFWFYLHDALMTTMFGCSLRKKGPVQILKGTCLFCSILFAAVYQGHINHVYTTLERFGRVEKLEELYRSGATLYSSRSMKEFMKPLLNPQDKLQRNFFDRIRSLGPERNGIILKVPGATSLGRKSDAKMEIFKFYSDKSGKPLIDIVDECFYTYYLSYIARAGFPFFKNLQIFLERMAEAGLPPLYYKWTQRMLGRPDSVSQYHSEPRPFSKIAVGDLRVAFGILLTGYVVSMIAFIAEKWRDHKLRHLKIPKSS